MRSLILTLALSLVTVASARAQCADPHLVRTPGGGYSIACSPVVTEAHPTLWKIAVTAVGATMFADAMTTAYAIGSHRGVERNPILVPFADRPALFGLVKGTLDVSALLTLFKLHENPARRKQALIVLAASAALSTAAVISNQVMLGGAR